MFQQYETACDIATRKDLNEIIVILKSIKPHKSGKKKKKSSETSDSDKVKSKDNLKKKIERVSFIISSMLYYIHDIYV